MNHQGLVDKDGNYRDQSRKKDGYLPQKRDDRLPFEALVTAWFPSSQTINVTYWDDWGQHEIEQVIVYGDFMESVGTIKTPKIATSKGTDSENTWQLYRDENSNQANPSSDEYVLNNHIAALVFKTSVGYAANSFRFTTQSSPLLANAKYGRTLKRYDDGSYRIHDDDGEMQFKHPSGLSVKIGKTGDDIALDPVFPDHAKNVLEYASGVVVKYTIPSAIGDIFITSDGTGVVKIEHPTGAIFEIGSTGLFSMENATTNLRQLHDDMNTIVTAIDASVNGGAQASALTALRVLTALLLK